MLKYLANQIQVSLDGTSNSIGALTSLIKEFELGPGVWAVTSDILFQCQLNNESGAGFGANPVTWLGAQGSTNLPDWQMIYIGPGETLHLVIRKFPGLPFDGTYWLNRMGDPK